MNIETVSANKLVEDFIESTVADEKEILSRLALVVHSNNSGSISCITRHDIVNGRLGIGNIISVEDVAATINAIESNIKQAKSNWFKSYNEENILVKDSSVIAWHRPRQTRTLYLTNEAINLEIPPLLYIFRTPKSNEVASLSVFALAANKRPNLKSKLYHAPLMNIYSDGRLCLGNMKLPRVIDDKTITLVESEFFGSRFTHPNHSNLTRKKMDIVKFYKMKQKSGQRIMTSELMPTKKTLLDILG